jgi:hypothetical protein
VAAECATLSIEAVAAHALLASASAQSGIKPQRNMTPSISLSCIRTTGT